MAVVSMGDEARRLAADASKFQAGQDAAQVAAEARADAWVASVRNHAKEFAVEAARSGLAPDQSLSSRGWLRNRATFWQVDVPCVVGIGFGLEGTRAVAVTADGKVWQPHGLMVAVKELGPWRHRPVPALGRVATDDEVRLGFIKHLAHLMEQQHRGR